MNDPGRNGNRDLPPLDPAVRRLEDLRVRTRTGWWRCDVHDVRVRRVDGQRRNGVPEDGVRQAAVDLRPRRSAVAAFPHTLQRPCDVKRRTAGRRNRQGCNVDWRQAVGCRHPMGSAVAALVHGRAAKRKSAAHVQSGRGGRIDYKGDPQARNAGARVDDAQIGPVDPAIGGLRDDAIHYGVDRRRRRGVDCQQRCIHSIVRPNGCPLICSGDRGQR